MCLRIKLHRFQAHLLDSESWKYHIQTGPTEDSRLKKFCLNILRISILFAICAPVFPMLDTSIERVPAKIGESIQVSAISIQNLPDSQKRRVPPKKKAPPRNREQWFNVSGFNGSTYVYGQVKILGKQDVVGYLYGYSGTQVYIYGELIDHNEIYAQDASGISYQLILDRKGSAQMKGKKRY